ncbi:MAG: DUF2927 domain-containing protein [Proteobacteria bacterium]|nr:DUF2927 domain-containing protein [Pseudomonadota bacterium]
MRILLATLFFLAVFQIPAPSGAIEDGPGPDKVDKTEAGGDKAPPTVDELVRYFEIIVFQSEFKSAAASTLIKKWTGPLRVAIRTFDEVTEKVDGRDVMRLKQGKVKQPHIRFIQKHLNSLIQATGLKTEDAKKTGKDPNFIINFVPRNQLANSHLAKVDPKLLRQMAAQGGCFFLMWADRKSGNISKAVIVVNSERLLIRINHCLLEEMTQSLGLPNDSNLINPSIFSDSSRRTDLTRTDLIILKTLYDRRMKVGMPHEKAMAVAVDIIRELNATLP